MKIIVDAMGGDNAPDEIVAGALEAHRELGVDIVLVGRTADILLSLGKQGLDNIPKGVEIANATQTIEMDDDPVTAVRMKKDSSMVVGLRMVRDGGGDAFVSAGSTGALLSGATLITKRIHGIRRAALAPMIPSKGDGVMIIDCGANAECSPEYLLQFAFMGSYYMQSVLKRKNPRVGLLNIGTERTKGTQLQLDTYVLLEKAAAEGAINFVGNVEAQDLLQDVCDVLVCDGFSGNVLLKSLEGTSRFFVSEIKSIFMSGKASKIAALMVKDGIHALKERMDPDKVGGTALLGISRPVVKAHGSSNARAVLNAIRHAVMTVDAGVVGDIEANIDKMKIDSAE